jgi:hypothetical protein
MRLLMAAGHVSATLADATGQGNVIIMNIGTSPSVDMERMMFQPVFRVGRHRVELLAVPALSWRLFAPGRSAIAAAQRGSACLGMGWWEDLDAVRGGELGEAGRIGRDWLRQLQGMSRLACGCDELVESAR